LGMGWLEKFRPMTCDWLERWIEFEYKNANTRPQGILSSNQQELQEVSAEQVFFLGRTISSQWCACSN
jgi:hypothetical protein